VDAGPIVGVERFHIPADITLSDLQYRAYASLARLYWSMGKGLATQTEPFPELPVRWSGKKTSRRCFAAMRDVPPDISRDELARRTEAFGCDQDLNYGVTAA
jgi:hypothetical protein